MEIENSVGHLLTMSKIYKHRDAICIVCYVCLVCVHVLVCNDVKPYDTYMKVRTQLKACLTP